MRILVTGNAGQLGYDVVKFGNTMNNEMVGIDRAEVDLTNVAAVNAFFEKEEAFDCIIHCAAYTAVDAAEDDVENVEKINVEATRYLVNAAKKMDAKFIYISTDYVYEGVGDLPYLETQSTNPLGVYGRTKLAGEEIVRTLEKHYIVRITWVFGINGNNFVKTMLRLAETNDKLTVVADQFGSPTYTKDLAPLLLSMAGEEKYGTYHATNEEICSWYDFACEIFRQAGKDIEVVPVASEEFPTKAVRPKNSRLSKEKLAENGFAKLPTWKDALERYLVELGTQVTE